MKIVAIIAACFLYAIPVSASSPITVGETQIINEYPETVTFEIDAASSAGAITSVEFNMMVRGGDSLQINPADFEPGQQVTAHYAWKTFRDSVPPGTPLQYTWTVRDDAGNKFTTEPQEYVVVDSRFTWQTLENDDVTLWWYDGDQEFGQRVFDAATEALAAMKQHTGQPLPHRLHVVLYGNDEDFDSWHSYVREWVGGVAYSGMGLTVQIIPPGNSSYVERWIQKVMPHEVAHLFFYQITDTPYAMAPPTWLNEGFAQYHEFASSEAELDEIREAVKHDELIPLRLLSGTFTGDEERIRLMYAESLSAVVFLTERWGDEGMADLLAAYQAGSNTDKALREATGLDFDEFQEAWWEWLGGQPGAYPTRRPTPAPPTPEPVWTAARPPRSTPTETLAASPIPAATATEAPTTLAAAPTPTATAKVIALATPKATPTAEPVTESPDSLPCLGALGLVGAAGVLSRRRPQD
jgi:hypothetical protein